jgi:hypothetical protein
VPSIGCRRAIVLGRRRHSGASIPGKDRNIIDQQIGLRAAHCSALVSCQGQCHAEVEKNGRARAMID